MSTVTTASPVSEELELTDVLEVVFDLYNHRPCPFEGFQPLVPTGSKVLPALPSLPKAEGPTVPGNY